MSRILCILDGMTDYGFSAADYPYLRKMELAGEIDTCCGCEPESLSCILHLLGVKAIPPFLRGYAEALGVGIPVGERDLILRGSWFGTDEKGRCTVPVPGPETIESGQDVRYYHLEQYKSLLVFPGLAEDIRQIITYPPYQCAAQPVSSLCPQGCAPLEKLFHEQWKGGRCLLPWGESAPAQLPDFPQKAAVVTGTAVVKGIARLLGMDLITTTSMTGDVDTDLPGKTDAALRAAEKYDFVLLHINGADEAGHRKNAAQKRAFLEEVDGRVLTALLRSEHDILVTADHGTDPVSGKHLSTSQPLFRSPPRLSTARRVGMGRRGR